MSISYEPPEKCKYKPWNYKTDNEHQQYVSPSGIYHAGEEICSEMINPSSPPFFLHVAMTRSPYRPQKITRKLNLTCYKRTIRKKKLEK